MFACPGKLYLKIDQSTPNQINDDHILTFDGLFEYNAALTQNL
jgi:hypothetical protein